MNIPKGFRNIVSIEAKKLELIRQHLSETAQRYGCSPIFLSSVWKKECFKKNMENSSVVVEKELINVDEQYCLRPELTLPTILACQKHNISMGKLYYFDSCFRGERPQQGRYRQFYQFGIEMFGGYSAVDDGFDMFYTSLMKWKCINSSIKIIINHLGSQDEREQYIINLKQYLINNRDNLSTISQHRLDKNNVLRILDSKEHMDQSIIKNSPKIMDFIAPHKLSYLNELVKKYPQVFIDVNLVRGLDYYDNLVFEAIDTVTGLAIGGGGCYDRFIHSISKGNIQYGIGFAIGCDRLVNCVSNINIVESVIYILNKHGSMDDIKKIRNHNINVIVHQFTKKTNLKYICSIYECKNVIIPKQNGYGIDGPDILKQILQS